MEVHEDVLAGALDIVENTVDTVAGRAASFGILEEPLTEFVKWDFIDEEEVARRQVRYTSPLGWKGMLFGIDSDRDSFLGDKAEGLARSVGQLTLAKAATLAGIPEEAVTAVNAYGAEMEEAYRNGATPREANISATVTALGEVGTEMLSGTIKFGGTAVDEVLVENLTDGISNKLLKALGGVAAGGIGEGSEEVLSEAISRFGQWITYMDDESFKEMLWSGDAREAYLDSFLSGFILGAPSAGAKVLLQEKDSGKLSEPAQDRSAGPGADMDAALADIGKRQGRTQVTQTQGTVPVDTQDSRAKPRIAGTVTNADIRDGDTSVPSRAEAPKTAQPEGDVPYFTSDHWTGELEGLWTENTADTVDTRAVDRQQPLRYEDALREYVGRETEHSRDPVTPQTAVPAQGSPVVDDSTQRTVQRPKDQVIAELAPKLQKPGITPGRAMIAAQETYADAEKRFGSDAQAVLEHLQPGQDPKRFLDGFQNAYILGKQGVKHALEDSKAAAYLTQAQRQYAFDLGAGKVKSLPAYSEAADARDRLSAIPVRGMTKLAQGFSAFPKGDVLNERIKLVKPDGNKFDVAMHGSPTAVAFGESEANMSPRLLARIILRSEGYHGQEIRLLSCNTGAVVDGGYCFAEELANALGVTVWAPNDLIIFRGDGTFYIGRDRGGEFLPFGPNERGRIK